QIARRRGSHARDSGVGHGPRASQTNGKFRARKRDRSHLAECLPAILGGDRVDLINLEAAVEQAGVLPSLEFPPKHRIPVRTVGQTASRTLAGKQTTATKSPSLR